MKGVEESPDPYQYVDSFSPKCFLVISFYINTEGNVKERYRWLTLFLDHHLVEPDLPCTPTVPPSRLVILPYLDQGVVRAQRLMTVWVWEITFSLRKYRI